MLERHPEELEWRFKLALKLSMVGDSVGYKRKLDTIRERDPKGLSLPMRRLELGQLREILGGCLRDPAHTPDPTDLSAFISGEKEDELLSDAWMMMGAVQNELGSIPKTLVAYRNTWKHATPLQRPDVGNGVAYAFWIMRDELSLENKRLALRISLRATRLFEEVNYDKIFEAQFLDTLACCYFMNEKYKLSLETLERCLELDQSNQAYEDRIREFSKR